MTRADEGEGRYTVVYKGDPAGNRILNGEPAVGRAVGVMLGDLIERAAQAEAEVARLTAALAEARQSSRELHRRAQKAEGFKQRHRGGFNSVINRRIEDRRARRVAEADASALRERVATLEAALQPFATYAADMPGADFGEGEIGEYYHGGFRRSIRTQDLRAARTALEAPHADK